MNHLKYLAAAGLLIVLILAALLITYFLSRMIKMNFEPVLLPDKNYRDPVG